MDDLRLAMPTAVGNGLLALAAHATGRPVDTLPLALAAHTTGRLAAQRISLEVASFAAFILNGVTDILG